VSMIRTNGPCRNSSAAGPVTRVAAGSTATVE
jgi:hypothetical protein